MDKNEHAVITYGTEAPTNRTAGELYLQYYDAEPEADYVVEFGINGIWTYRKWKSGLAECWGTAAIKASLQNDFEDVNLFYNSTIIERIDYPIEFIKTPVECTNLLSSSGVAWLASKSLNSKSSTAAYAVISADKLVDSTQVYYLSQNYQHIQLLLVLNRF